MARRLILALSAPRKRPSASRMGTASTIAAFASPRSQYASPRCASPAGRVFSRSTGSDIAPVRPPLLVTARPRASMISSVSKDGKRSRAEVR